MNANNANKNFPDFYIKGVILKGSEGFCRCGNK